MEILISWPIIKFFGVVIAIIAAVYVLNFAWLVIKSYRDDDFFGDDW